MNSNPSKNEVDHVREALRQFNDERVGNDCHTPLNIVEYDGEGNVIAGILGGTYWGWMYVDILWVHEDHRRKGIGSRLLATAEREATARGCHHVHLDTMSWQAPDFYKKQGYEVIGVLPDIPDGNQKYLLMKKLQNDSKKEKQ
jgi:ribosomal protein S18 acetylase RimI-like enzyme